MTLLLRRLCALLLLIGSFLIWRHHSDVIELILRQRPVLFGRYSQGHFGVLLILTPILWALAAAFATRAPLLPQLGNCLIGIVSTLVAILAITYGAHFFHRAALYVESAPAAPTSPLAGIVKHRPPDQVYDLTYIDAPEQARSYPNPPPGFSPVTVHLTSDHNGFRNTVAAAQYDILAVGDSFVAGSNVSDAQCWTALLANSSGHSIYNLGVGGSGPPTYLSNFYQFGLQLKPRIALFMIYEGNDFKEDVVLHEPKPPTLGERIETHFAEAMQSSPVTLGLKRLSHDLLEKLGSNRPVPGYQEKLGFMPIKLTGGAATQYYSFDPKRLLYLNYSVREFANSREWLATADILQQIVKLSREHGIQPIFIYAPSAPHVILPLVEQAIPAQQLRNFAAYKSKHLPAAEVFKQQIFSNLDSEQQVVTDFCKQQQVDCLALTHALRAASASGQQTYFTYDQHWTPLGNAVAASAIETFLRAKNLL